MRRFLVSQRRIPTQTASLASDSFNLLPFTFHVVDSYKPSSGNDPTRLGESPISVSTFPGRGWGLELGSTELEQIQIETPSLRHKSLRQGGKGGNNPFTLLAYRHFKSKLVQSGSVYLKLGYLIHLISLSTNTITSSFTLKIYYFRTLLRNDAGERWWNSNSKRGAVDN
jgi:hypothetical protein